MKYLFLVMVSLCFFELTAQTPSWVEPEMRRMKYPDNVYLTGFASEMNLKKEDAAEVLKRCESYAKNRLNESVLVSVQSVSNLEVTETNSNILEYFKTSTASSSYINLSGLKTETYFDSKSKTGYAFVYAKRTDIENIYRNLIETKKTAINDNVQLAKSLLAGNDKQKAMKKYQECYPLLREIEEAQAVLAALAINQIEKQNLYIKEVSQIKTSFELEMNSLLSGQGNTPADQAFVMSNTLKTQIGDIQKPIRLTNLTFQDTKMGSQFSRRFSGELEQKLVTAGLSVTNDAGIPGQEAQQTPFLLTGNYWIEGGFVKLTILVKNIETGKLLASAEGKISKSWLDENQLAYLPENYKDALVNQKLFGKDEIIAGDLSIDIYTNKGKDNLIFVGGEKLKLLVRSNKECFIRCIYHMADGSKVLLLDNYYISSDKINQLIELPYEFECAEPFGVETLQLNAQNKAFEPLKTRREYGYDFIENDLSSTLVATRGIKRIDDQTPQKAEKRILVTTMSK